MHKLLSLFFCITFFYSSRIDVEGFLKADVFISMNVVHIIQNKTNIIKYTFQEKQKLLEINKKKSKIDRDIALENFVKDLCIKKRTIFLMNLFKVYCDDYFYNRLVIFEKDYKIYKKSYNDSLPKFKQKINLLIKKKELNYEKINFVFNKFRKEIIKKITIYNGGKFPKFILLFLP